MDTRDATPEDEPNPIKMQLEPFFLAHGTTKAELRDDVLFIVRPWNDPTVTILVKKGDEALISALNSVYLPTTFSAIWHKDTKDLEFIWNALPNDKDLINRSFRIYYDKSNVACEWADASERLAIIAAATFASRPIPNETNYRNIMHFQRGMMVRKAYPASIPPDAGSPTSFWIRCIDWEEEAIIRLAKHINFYMRYYDRNTPVINVFEEVQQSESVMLSRYPRSIFPPQITGLPIDPYLLDLWSTATSTQDPLRRLLHSYQIIEYAAFYYVKNDIAENVRKIISKPDAPSRVDEVTALVIEAMTAGHLEDAQKLRNVLKECIDLEDLWFVIDSYRNTFSKTTIFDGGFSLEPLIAEKASCDDFKPNWAETFGIRLDKLRNAAVHAREKRNSNSIAPTRANHERLTPWATLTLSAAEQIMIYPKKYNGP